MSDLNASLPLRRRRPPGRAPVGVRLVASLLSLVVLLGTGLGAAHGHDTAAESPLVCAVCHVAHQAPVPSEASSGLTTDAVELLVAAGRADDVRPVRRGSAAPLGARAPPHSS